MVQSDMSKSPPSPAQEVQMELLDNPVPAAAAQSYAKGARRKNRFKGSDGSTSSDTTSNSFVRQISLKATAVMLVAYACYCGCIEALHK
ncbi:voltage-dependent L-type calcium channel subunit beta-2-like protein [Turdus rufiventris]|nr:voltage-dependent L-type calcium channel subunit beta-2-like protein [Turdus rufiventris]